MCSQSRGVLFWCCLYIMRMETSVHTLTALVRRFGYDESVSSWHDGLGFLSAIVSNSSNGYWRSIYSVYGTVAPCDVLVRVRRLEIIFLTYLVTYLVTRVGAAKKTEQSFNCASHWRLSFSLIWSVHSGDRERTYSRTFNVDDCRKCVLDDSMNRLSMSEDAVVYDVVGRQQLLAGYTHRDRQTDRQTDVQIHSRWAEMYQKQWRI